MLEEWYLSRRTLSIHYDLRHRRWTSEDGTVSLGSLQLNLDRTVEDTLPTLWSGYIFTFWLGQSTDLANPQRRSLKICTKEEFGRHRRCRWRGGRWKTASAMEVTMELKSTLEWDGCQFNEGPAPSAIGIQ